jgi:hypothetical protein
MQERKKKKNFVQLNLLQVKLWPCKGLEKDTGTEVSFDLVPLVSSAEKKAPLRNFRDGQGALFTSGMWGALHQNVSSGD